MNKVHMDDSKWDYWLDQAWEQAKIAADKDEVPVGAIVVHHGEVIARAHNLRESLQNPVAHAEVLALQQAAQTIASWRLLECELFVTLEPCPMCMGACQLARVQKVIYGALDKKGGALSLGYRLHEDIRLNHRFKAFYHPKESCKKILSEFFRKKRGDGKQPD